MTCRLPIKERPRLWQLANRALVKGARGCERQEESKGLSSLYITNSLTCRQMVPLQFFHTQLKGKDLEKGKVQMSQHYRSTQ